MKKATRNRHTGSSFEVYLEEEGKAGKAKGYQVRQILQAIEKLEIEHG
jgi:hypothetical protein